MWRKWYNTLNSADVDQDSRVLNVLFAMVKFSGLKTLLLVFLSMLQLLFFHLVIPSIYLFICLLFYLNVIGMFIESSFLVGLMVTQWVVSSTISALLSHTSTVLMSVYLIHFNNY